MNVDEYNECQPRREKYWSEMTTEEKLEKAMNELVRTQKNLAQLSEFINKIAEHDHNKDGKMITLIEYPDSISNSGFYFRQYNKR